MNHLAESLHFENSAEFKDFINCDKIELTGRRGRRLCNKDTRQKIYYHWLDNSEISNDR